VTPHAVKSHNIHIHSMILLLGKEREYCVVLQPMHGRRQLGEAGCE
jgi:hypothetical protein